MRRTIDDVSETPQGPEVVLLLVFFLSRSLIRAVERYDTGTEADAITVKLIEGEVKLSQQ